MDELIPVELNNHPTEANQKTVPIPAEGKKLYISHNSVGIDFQALLGHVVQCVNMGEILAEIKAGTQYVVQIPAEFQKAYESGEMFIMENMKTGKKWPSLMKIAEDGRKRSTEGVNLSGDLRVGNCNWIALRRTPLRADAEGAKRVTVNLSGKRTE